MTTAHLHRVWAFVLMPIVLEKIWSLLITFGKTLLFHMVEVIPLTSHYSTNLNSTCQEMEVIAEGAAVNCFCLTQFGRPSLVTVNFSAISSPIGGIRLTQQRRDQTAATFQTRTDVTKEQK